jgi:hypothetical protein
VKEKFTPIAQKRLNNQRGWLLSHTLRCGRRQNRGKRFEKPLNGVIARFFPPADTD